MEQEQATLETLYNFIESSKKLGIELPEDILQKTAALEEQLIRKDVLPVLRDNIEPVLNQIKRELILVVEYHPEEPISVRISRKRNLSDLSEATPLTPDPVPEFNRRSPQQRTGKRHSPTLLKVTTRDGGVFFDESDATKTYCAVIEHIGPARIRGIQDRIKKGKLKLVSTTEDDNRQHKQIGNYYVLTNLSTSQKGTYLKKISDEMGLGLKVEVVE